MSGLAETMIPKVGLAPLYRTVLSLEHEEFRSACMVRHGIHVVFVQELA